MTTQQIQPRTPATLSGIDLAAPDGLEQLFAWSRTRFGAATMTAGGPGDPPPPPPPAPAPEPPKPTPPPAAFTPPATQDEYDRAINARVAREREKYADYDALRAKAEQFDAAAEAAKTEQEKAVDAARTEGRSAAVREANEKAATSILRAGLAARGVSETDQTTLLEAVNVAAFLSADGSDVDTTKVAAYATRVAGAPAGGVVGLDQGLRTPVGQGFGSGGRAEAARRYPTPATSSTA